MFGNIQKYKFETIKLKSNIAPFHGRHTSKAAIWKTNKTRVQIVIFHTFVSLCDAIENVTLQTLTRLSLKLNVATRCKRKGQKVYQEKFQRFVPKG